jgi:hypothetical protein
MVYDEKNEEDISFVVLVSYHVTGRKCKVTRETTKGNILKKKDATFKLLQGGTSL